MNMNNDQEKFSPTKNSSDMKSRVMGSIKTKKIKMRSRIVFVLEKLGLEGALFLVLLLGAILISLIFYFIEKIRLEKFLMLGMSGTEIFFETLPYDYLFLFVVAVASAIYLANRLELFCGKCERTDTFAWWFFLGALGAGIMLGALGVGGFLGGWSHKKIPSDRAVHGQIQSFSDDSEVTVVDDDGKIVRIFSPVPPLPDAYMSGMFLRAVGHRDSDDPTIFHADRVRCCDDD